MNIITVNVNNNGRGHYALFHSGRKNIHANNTKPTTHPTEKSGDEQFGVVTDDPGSTPTLKPWILFSFGNCGNAATHFVRPPHIHTVYIYKKYYRL